MRIFGFAAMEYEDHNSPPPQLSKECLSDRLKRRAGHFMPASLLESQLQTLEEPDPLTESVMTIDGDGRCPGGGSSMLAATHNML